LMQTRRYRKVIYPKLGDAEASSRKRNIE